MTADSSRRSRPAGVRGRCVAPAPHAADRPAPPPRGGAGAAASTPGRRAGARRPALREVDRLAQIVDELLVLSRRASTTRRGEASTWRRPRSDAVSRWSTVAARARQSARAGRETAGRRRSGARGPTSTARSTRSSRTRCLLAAGQPGHGPRRRPLDRRGGRGPGPATGEEQEVFERFSPWQAPVAGPEGTGLGLSIARGACPALGRGRDDREPRRARGLSGARVSSLYQSFTRGGLA